MESINLQGIGVIKIRRGVHIKYLSIRMAPGKGIWVNVPFGVSGSQVKKFIEERRDWIFQNRQVVKDYEKKTEIAVSIGSEIQTRLHTLKIEETAKESVFYEIEGKRITLYVPQTLKANNLELIIQRFLSAVYRKEALMVLPQRVMQLAEQYGFSYRKLSFRNNTSNWGSCSHDNKLSLNVKLMKLPDDVIDYVILHELCHTVEKNHSADFWQCVEKVCPDYKQKIEALRRYTTK